MAAATQISVTEYLNTTHRPDRDYVDGDVLERNLGEYEHSRPQGLLAARLFDQEKQRRIVVLIAQRIQVGPVASASPMSACSAPKLRTSKSSAHRP
jgi:hypothetical protein